MTCAIRHASPSDAIAACGLVRRSIVELCYGDHRGDPDALAKWLSNKTPAHFERWVTSDQHIALVAEIDGALVGFGLLSRQGTIALLYVSPDTRFRGVSKGLLAALEREAIAAGISELELESSLTALPFYSRFGYVPARPPCQGFGATTCYPMSKRLVAIAESSTNGAPSA